MSKGSAISQSAIPSHSMVPRLLIPFDLAATCAKLLKPAVSLCSQDMQSIMSAAVMRWWPDEMVPMNRSGEAQAEAKALWEGTHLYEPFDITSQVAAKYGASLVRSLVRGWACNGGIGVWRTRY